MKKPVFQENVTIITGASSGIGRSLALQMAEQGAWLALAARDVEALESVVETCIERGARAISVRTDVTDQSQCQALIQRTVDEYGRIDTLVNNAGISMWALFEDVQNLEPFEKLMQVNYLGSVYCTHYALPYLKQTQGRIAAVASLTALFDVPTRTGYSASKHAMKGFFDTLRVELLGSGVTVTVSYPDFVATALRDRAFGADGKPLGKSSLEEHTFMTADTSARLLLKALEGRKREDKQTLRARAGVWIKLISPGLVDRTTRKAYK